MKRNVKKIVLTLFLLSGLFFAQSIFAQADFGTGAVNSGLGGSLNGSADPRTIIARIINIALGFLGIIAVGLILYAGFKWMMSNGDEEKISDAKSTLKNGIIGLVIVLSAWGIATFILRTLGGAINGGSSENGCINGNTQSCGCGGSMVCTNGAWSGCVGGSNLNGCLTPPKTCDSDGNLGGCQAANQICAAGYFCDDSCSCQLQGNAGDSCDGDTTNSTCDADNARCSAYTTCDPSSCLCVGSPVITGVSPMGGFCNNNNNKSCSNDDDCGNGDTCNTETANGAINNFITVSGKNFGEYSEGTSQLIFLGDNSPKNGLSPAAVNSACVDFWNDNQIIIAVPSGAQSGPIQIVNKDNLSDRTDDDNGPSLNNFVVNSISRPGLCSLDPTIGALSSEVNYQGVNLYSGNAYFGNYDSNVKALYSVFADTKGLTGTSTIPNIKSGESGSFVETMVAGSIQKSNFLEFTKSADESSGPYIISFTPVETLPNGQKISRGSAGQYVTIIGAGFGGARGNSHVYFVGGNNKTEALYSFPAICVNSVWSDNQIIVKVPEMADDNYQIQIDLGDITISTQNLNPNVFTLDKNVPLKPSLCKIDPKQGPVDTSVTLWGEYFGTKKSNGLVRFNYGQDVSGVIGEEGNAQTINVNVPPKSTTGPVKVVSSKGEGNGLNFSVGECEKNEECDNGICCPQNTYKKGMCVSEISKCFSEIKTSVFEWGFSTSLAADTNLTFDSCLGLSKYLGSCYQGASCPNSPGACSSPSTSYQKTVGTCDITCKDVPGCNELTCKYNETVDRCVKNKTAQDGACDLAQSITFTSKDYNFTLEKEYTTEKTCNNSGKWEINSSASCPIGWTRINNNKCVQDNSSCGQCGENLSCQKIGDEGRCVSSELCADKARCVDNQVASEADKCVIDVAPSCECCCRIGYDTQDCCAGLTCSGKCGSDIINNSNTYGSCSGCAAAGDTAEERDAACNCSGHDSQFCSVSSEHPEGICTDCSGLEDQASCGDHSSACCFDSNKTATTTDDYCRGVNGSSVISTDKKNANYGYCAYYGCYSANTSSSNYPAIPVGDPYECASTTPVRVGFFNKVDACVKDCPEGIGTDICRTFDNNQSACSSEATCCYDKATLKCLSGDKIIDGAQKGYCAYYGCKTDSSNSYECNPVPKAEATKFTDVDSCSEFCANPPEGPGLNCGDNKLDASCNFGLCSFEGFACLKGDGTGGASSECGTCCCDPNAAVDACVSAATPNLHCLANVGACSGAGRGLCCGCSSDNDCGSISTTGCGSDTCCAARPSVVETSPAASETNVCRNAAIKVSFDQKMDSRSLSDNFLLFAELTYGEGVCPSGTFLADNQSVESLINPESKNIFARLWNSVNLSIRRLLGQTSNQALAEAPSDNKLYCRVPGSVSFSDNGVGTDLIFYPTSILSPATKYYAVVKGDEKLDSQTGVLSSSEVGMNGKGFDNNGTFIAGSQIKFNKLSYPGSYSFQFITLSSQGSNAGICVIDHVDVGPASYLFKTTSNDLEEKDDDINSGSFDSVSDRDKLFMASAFSADNQLLTPVNGYSWNWVWSIDNPEVVDIANSVVGLTEDKSFVIAKQNVTDGEAKLKAEINMDKFRPANNCLNSCNKFFVGDEEYDTSDLYVFVCENPWPAPKANGEWFPWNDTGSNCSSGSGACEGYNYKFYYCRDAGSSGTLDDLPAISNEPVTRGLSFICSSDKSSCSVSGAACGVDANGDGLKDGVCLSELLKESYFFRETILSGGNITNTSDTGKGGEIKVDWQSPAANVYSYKIYYLRSGKGSMVSKEIKAADACKTNGSVNNCSAVINGLVNNQPYIFKLTVISTNKTESILSSEKIATPTDKTVPATPSGLKATVDNSQLNFSWKENLDDTNFYRLYHGITSGKYAEYFDSIGTSAAASFPLNQFSEGSNYFAVSAIDSAKNESPKSTELTYYYLADNYWYQAPNQAAVPAGSDCLVKLFVSPTTSKVDCNVNNEDMGANFGLFTGVIKNEGINPYCSTKDCPAIVNANKCRWWNSDWNYQCYIHN